MNTELEELREALSASPENHYIRKLLIKKIKQIPEYRKEWEELVQDGLHYDSHNVYYKSELIQVYFHKERYSTCIVISEDLDLFDLTLEACTIIAKCYLREGNRQKSKEYYKHVIEQQEDFEDEELDDAFRIRMDKQEVYPNQDHLFTKPDISFEDVGGMQNVKREIDMKIIKPLENVELFAQYGKKVGGGILLYGPPGCGKTFIAKATAGQINANFINIGLNDILDMWHGESEKNLNRIFEIARSNSPCVIFFDEVDALGAKRSDLRGSTGKTVINQFLSELDGIQSKNDGLLIIGATNTPWHLDSAFLRPGRFDRIIFVPPPDEESKQSILRLKLKDKPCSEIDYKKVAKHLKDYSGADINALIDIAVESVLEEALQTGVPKPLSTKLLISAAKQHKASTIDWFTTAKNYAMFANKSGLYNDVLKYIK